VELATGESSPAAAGGDLLSATASCPDGSSAVSCQAWFTPDGGGAAVIATQVTGGGACVVRGYAKQAGERIVAQAVCL
jgi:hypothetical protein